MEETYQSLLALQDLDRQIADAEARLREFDPKLDELRAPLVALEKEREAAAAELAQMRENVQRMERNAGRNRERVTAYEQRLGRARGADDEATIRAELDLISRAVDADVQEAGDLSRQITRIELRLEELAQKIEAQRDEIRPQEEQVLAERTGVEEELALLRQQRHNQAVRLDQPTLRLYERVRMGKSRSALASLTRDGACGNCFNVVPVQRQAEIRRAGSIQRCEACGVLLYPEKE
jgi:uncharacterized protein